MTRKLPLLAGLLTVSSLAFSIPLHAAQPQYKIKWLLGHPNLDYFEEAAKAFKQTVETESKGAIAVEIVTAEREALGDAAEAKAPAAIAAAVSKGEAQMGHSFTNVISPIDPKMMAFEAPYLFRGYRHLEGVFEGPVGNEMLGDLKNKGLVGLSFTYSGGASGVATVNKELRAPADLKGLKVGIYGDAVETAWLESLGATVVPVQHNRHRILPLTAEGKLDAVLITWRNFERAGLQKKYKNFNLAGASYLVSVTYINQKFYDGLPKQYQDLLARASRESGRIERAQTIELNEISKREMQAKGVRPVFLSEAAQASFVEALKPAYAKSIDATLGEKLIEKLKGVKDSPVAPLLPKASDFASR